ncbi:MAG: O-acetyl-ADP-ribose deacetylase [Thermomicrobiales bacterium]
MVIGESLLDRIELIRGDITSQQVEAIVNAANTSLLGGGGVDGAIHHAAGPGLLAETRTLGGCPTGEARLTSGHHLPARWVIHTVGPIWQGGGAGEPTLLRRCYQSVFAIASKPELDIGTIAFPGISIGVYGYPVGPATAIALEETVRFLESSPRPENVRFVLYSQATLEVYEETLASLGNAHNREQERM